MSMRKALFLALAATVSFSVAAQQQPQQRPKPQEQEQEQKAETKDPMVERQRVEGAAGGTAPVPPEKRKAVGAGAGPHRKDELPSPARLPRDEPVRPPR
jgi:hypothetical protein